MMTAVLEGFWTTEISLSVSDYPGPSTKLLCDRAAGKVRLSIWTIKYYGF
jgi:hypothetical protein